MFVIFILTASMSLRLRSHNKRKTIKSFYNIQLPVRSVVSGFVGVKIFEVGLKKNKLEITEERRNG